MNKQPRFIVGEVSKNWNEDYPRDAMFLNSLFEGLIQTNLDRGYVLHSFSLHRLMQSQDIMNETIIAVFERI